MFVLLVLSFEAWMWHVRPSVASVLQARCRGICLLMQLYSNQAVHIYNTLH